MIKDEDDIIYENLAWHFAVGFRKFILIDNNSSDNTRNLIQKFINETKELATVILIHDPIEEHNQYKLMTAAYRMSHEIWPEAEWIFPVDADEFWIFSKTHQSRLLLCQNGQMLLASLKQNIIHRKITIL